MESLPTTPSRSTSSPPSALAALAADPQQQLQVREWLRSAFRSSSLDDGTVTLSPPFPLLLPTSSSQPQPTASEVSIMTLSNPARKNSLSGKMMAELADAIDHLTQQTSTSVVVVAGVKGTFCSGLDLRLATALLKSGDKQAGERMGAFMTLQLNRLRSLNMVSVAAIEGHAIGGGAELTTACDFRVMSEDARVQFVHARMGLTPGWGGGGRLVQLVGRSAALQLLCVARPLKSVSAMELGFADHVAPRGSTVLQAALDFARPILHHPLDAVVGCKAVVSGWADRVSMSTGLDEEHHVFASLWGGPSNLQALQSRVKPETS
eukprot:jgi/Chlat1/1634/Chrsp127S00087